MLDPTVNFGRVNVSTGYSSSATSVVLSSGEGSKLPNPSTDGAFNLGYWDKKNYPNASDDPNKEIVRVAEISGDTLTIVRGQENTTATDKNTTGGEYVMILAPTKKMMDDIDAGIVGWNSVTDVIPTRDSTDDPTYVINFAGVDITDKVSVGQKIHWKQDVDAEAYYKFEDDATDEQGNHDGTASNVTYTTDKFSKGAVFNGSSSEISLGTPAGFKTAGGSFAMGCWFKSSTTATTMALFVIEDSSRANASLMAINPDSGFAYYNDSETWITSGDTSMNAVHCDGNWHFGVLSFNGTSIKGYVDGEQIFSKNISAPTDPSTAYAYLGKRAGNIQYFNGTMDDMFFINGQSLSETAIKKIYESGAEVGSFPISTERYGFVTAINFLTDTSLTLYGGTDYDVDDTATYTISDVKFSSMQAPYGFPSKFTRYGNYKALAYRSGNQSIPNATETVIQLNAEKFDFNNDFDVSTNYRYDVGVAGVYSVSGAARFNGQTNRLYLSLEVNGSSVFITENYNSSVNPSCVNFNTLVSLSNGDNVNLKVYQSSGGSLSIEGARQDTFLSLELTRPS